MGQGRGAHAQSAFFLAGLLFLPAFLSAGARESDADVDAIIRRCRGMRDLGEASENVSPALISAVESLDFVESDPSH